MNLRLGWVTAAHRDHGSVYLRPRGTVDSVRVTRWIERLGPGLLTGELHTVYCDLRLAQPPSVATAKLLRAWYGHVGRLPGVTLHVLGWQNLGTGIVVRALQYADRASMSVDRLTLEWTATP